ncbi:MAG: carboxymuconolactone decarboxylase family protein [Novosphingobium sp.]|jgi:alkylhydroperoxidase/carboxymuconolactone decarboxylase family protein YurZ|nr:carboxymuconolactone decarboxylase family protein [Novosphingobium sp.]
MGVLTQEERIEAERKVHEQLGLPMMCANPANSVSAETLQVEREILGAQAYAFGEIWSRPHLDIRDRCCITLAILMTKCQPGPLADYVRASLRVGIAASDILEIFLHVGTYAGLTAAAEAMNVARAVFTEQGITSPADEAITPVYPMDRQGRLDAVARIVRDVGIGRKGLAPDAAPMHYLRNGVWGEKAQDLETEQDYNRINGEYGYGECWGRPALGYRVRSLITMASLQAQALNDQLAFHINNAINLGISGDEIQELLGHGAIYCGGGNWRNAANVAREIFLSRGIVEPARGTP